MNELPKYARIKEEIINKLAGELADGRIRPGDKVCSETDIIVTYDVSPTTARRVLNDLVQEGKIRRIQGKGSFLADWQTNTESNSFRPKTIGLIIPGVTFSFYAEICYGCEKAAHAHGYRVILCNAIDPKEEVEYLQRCYDDRVDGIVIASTGIPVDELDDDQTCQHLVRNTDILAQISKDIPMVIVDNVTEGVNADYVITDNVAGAKEAVNHLLEIGRRRIVHLAGPLGVTSADGRLEGYRLALQEAGLEVDKSLIKRGGYFERLGYKHMKDLLTEDKEFDAVFACDDQVATGAYRALTEHGLRVPEDVAVMGFADESEPIARGLRLSSVDQQEERMGEEAMEMLAEKIGRTPRVTTPIIKMVPTKLIVRQSTTGTSSSGQMFTEDKGDLMLQGA